MRTVTASEAVLVVSASRFGYPGVLAEFVGSAQSANRAAELASALGELAAAVQGVTVALAGESLPRRGQRGPLDTMAELVVCCATQGDTTGIELICADAAANGLIAPLLCGIVRDINTALDRLDQLPGPGAGGLLERLGLAAATSI